MRPVHLRATLPDLDSTLPFQGREQHEQTAHSIALVFVVVGRHRAGRCGTGHSRLLDPRSGSGAGSAACSSHPCTPEPHSRHTNAGKYRARLPLRTQTRRSVRAGCTNSASATACPVAERGLEFVFLSTWRTVSVLMVSTISHSTNWSANSFRVQLARPSGGSPQAIAINRASRSPSSIF